MLHGGPEAEVRALIKDLRQASKIPLLIGAELERGVGPAVLRDDGTCRRWPRSRRSTTRTSFNAPRS